MKNKEGIIKVDNGILSYINDRNVSRFAFFKTKSFQIKIEDLKIIGIYRSLFLDDELDMLVFIDKNGNKNYIPLNYDLESSSFLILMDRFYLDLNLIQNSEIEDYTKQRSIILYPKELEGSSLYKKSNILTSILKMLRIKPIADGDLTVQSLRLF